MLLSQSVLSNESREHINRSVIVSQKVESVLDSKRHSENESVHSILNRTFINGYFKQQNENSYGDVAWNGVINESKRPMTSKQYRSMLYHKRASSGRPQTSESKHSVRHRKHVSLAADDLNMNTLLRVTSFGIPGYKTPNWGLQPRMDKNCKFLKTKYKNFLTEYAKSREFIPPPGKYNINRSLLIKNKRMHFGKGTRVTSTDVIIRQAKKNKVGPGQYKINNKHKVLGLSKISMRKSVAFIDDAEYKAKNMPGFYKIKEIRKRVLTPDFK